MTNFELIFDNGGGITLQTEGFAHHYNSATQAAQDAKAIMDGENPSDWDGNEPECRMEYDADTERNGGYQWYTQDDIAEVDSDSGWANIAAFAQAIK